MAVTALRARRSIQDGVSPEEWQVRVDLAALYRLVAKHGLTDLTATHISARLPGPEHHFLLNPHGLLFDQVTASNLVKIDMDGTIVGESDYPVNAAGFCIHSAVHMARPDLACVAHTHTAAGMAVSALPEGLLSLTQKSMRFHNQTAYHDYEGIAFDLDERDRLIRDFGDKHTMILRNHGVLVGAPSVRLAWTRLYTLEKAMQAQLAAMAAGGTLLLPSKRAADHCAAQWDRGDAGYRQDGWESQLRLLDRADPSWRH